MAKPPSLDDRGLTDTVMRTASGGDRVSRRIINPKEPRDVGLPTTRAECRHPWVVSYFILAECLRQSLFCGWPRDGGLLRELGDHIR